VTGETAWGFQSSLITSSTVLVSALGAFGAGPAMLGMIPAIETGGWLLPQVLGPYIFTSRSRLKLHLVLWHLLVAIPFLFLASVLLFAAPHLPDALVRWGVLACFGVFIWLLGTLTAVWMDWWASLMPDSLRGTVMGASFSGAQAAAFVGSLLAGAWLARVPGASGFAGLYAGAGLFAMLSMVSFLVIRDPMEGRPPDSRRPKTTELLTDFRETLVDRSVQAVLVGRFLGTVGVCLTPFIAVHYASVEGGSLSQSRVVSCYAACTVGMALSTLIAGRAGDRVGHRAGFLAGSLAQVVGTAILLLVDGQWGCMLTYALIGVASGTGLVSQINLMLEICPHDNRVAHLTAGNLVVGLVSIVAPLMGGMVAARFGVIPLFVVCLAFSLASFLWILLAVREPRRA
jgi:predicted MFS family arabinose efflux permease